MDEFARRLGILLREAPMPDVSTDVRRAVTDGRRVVRRRRWLLTAAVAGVVTVALVGTVTLLGVRQRSDMPATGSPPGTEIAPWLTSPPGTLLLGDGAFPYRKDGWTGKQTPGFEALALVTGDPYQVMRDVIHQLDDAGFRVRTSGSTCTAGASQVTCDVVADHAADGAQAVLSVELVVRRGTDPYRSYLSFRYVSPPPHLWDYGLERTAEPPNGRSPVQPPSSPTAPGVGEQFVPGRQPQPGYPGVKPDYRVVEGSRPLARPMQTNCAGFTTVVRVTGDPARVIREYVTQFGTGMDEPWVDDRYTVDGIRVEHHFWAVAGGGNASVYAATRPGQPTYLLLEVCDNVG